MEFDQDGGLRRTVVSVAIGVVLAGSVVAIATPATAAMACGGWAVVPTPSLTTASQLLGIAEIGPGDVWAVGLTNSPFPGAPLAEHWDGAAWSVVPTAPGASGFLWAVDGAVSDDAWAVGDTGTIEHWNGTAWSNVAIPLPSGASHPFLRDVHAVSSTDVWAVGWYTASATEKTLVLHWNGSSWSRIPSPIQAKRVATEFWGVAVRSDTDVWAVGRYVKNGEFTFSAHWNGSSWSKPTMPASPSTQDTYLGQVVTVGTAGAWAVGTSGSGDLIERYANGGWQIVTGLTGVGGLHGLLAFGPANIYASGGSNGEPVAEHWNGASWSGVATPAVPPGENGLFDLDGQSGTDLWGAGDQGGTGGVQTLVEHAC